MYDYFIIIISDSSLASALETGGYTPSHLYYFQVEGQAGPTSGQARSLFSPYYSK